MSWHVRPLFGFVAVVALVVNVQAARAPNSPEDFCSSVNAAWSKTTSIPANRPWIGEYVEAYDLTQQQIRSVVVNADAAQMTSAARTIHDLFQSAMDGSTRNQLGFKPLADDLQQIERARSPVDIAALMVKFNRRHLDLVEGSLRQSPIPFLLTVGPSDVDSTRYVFQIHQSGLGLPGRDYYFEDNPKLRSIRDAYIAFMTRTFALTGDRKPEESAASAFDLESKIARVQWSSLQLQDRQARREMNLDDLKRLAPNFSWATYFHVAGLAASSSIAIRQPSYIAAVTSLLAQSPAQQVVDYFRWQLLRHYSPYLASAMTENAATFLQVLLGSETAPTDEAAAIMLVQSYLPKELDALYVKRYFPPESKAMGQQIVEKIRAAWLRRIQNTTWLSMDAKSEAIKKIQTLHAEIGYPDRFPTYDSVHLEPHGLVKNLIKLSEREYRQAKRKLAKKVDRNEWWMSVTSVDGSYSQSLNTLIIPAGRMHAPMFDAKASDADNMGGIGTLIGHEMGHALDNQGSQYDSSGNLRDWWTPADHRNFTERTEILIKYYEAYEPMPGWHIDGAATLSENIADLSGLTVAYDALRMQNADRELSSEERMQFFSAWAKRWRVKYSDQMLIRLKSDTHPPNQFRCSGPLGNFPPFFETYELPSPSALTSIW